MIYLHIVGLVVAAGLMASVLMRWRRGRLRRNDVIIMSVLSLGLAVISIAPSVVQPLLNVLGFPAGESRRVIGVLVISNILVYFLILRSYAKTDRVEGLLSELADRLAFRHFSWENPGADGFRERGKLVVVIPALNEQSSLPEVLGAIPKQIEGLDAQVVVVSDGSTDDTERVARDWGAIVVGRDLRRGQGAAVSLGYRVGLALGADIVATVDADGQYDPLEIARLVRPILDVEADVVHGSRVLGE